MDSENKHECKNNSSAAFAQNPHLVYTAANTLMLLPSDITRLRSEDFHPAGINQGLSFGEGEEIKVLWVPAAVCEETNSIYLLFTHFIKRVLSCS